MNFVLHLVFHSTLFRMQASRTADHLMATRRRDVLPGKEKATSSPQTATAKLKGAVNKITKTNVSTALKQQTKTDASKPQVRKPASSATVNKPAQARTRPLVTKTVASPKPVQKTRVASVAAAPSRSSSFPSRTVASPKPVPGKSLKPVIKDEGKRRLSPPASNARRSSIGLKKKETGTLTSAKKEPQITSFTVDKVEDLSMYCAPEPEIQLNDIEYSYLTEAEEKTIQSLSDMAKSSINALVTEIDQEPLYFAKVGDEIDHADSKVVIAESYPVSEQKNTLDIKIQEFKNKYNLEDSSSKQESEHDTKKTNSCNKVEKLAGNSHEAGEQEVKEVKVAAQQQEAAAAKKDEAAVVSKADESKEVERPSVEKKKEISFPPKQQERTHGKIDSPVSNDVIEETANKLREQRRNRVRALAGAFETIISLQEK